MWLTEELASSTARVSQLQLEVSTHQQKAAELQAKLSAALQDSEGHSTQLASQETQLEGEAEIGGTVNLHFVKLIHSLTHRLAHI